MQVNLTPNETRKLPFEKQKSFVERQEFPSRGCPIPRTTKD
jgi:hypothetical protein